MARILAIDYGRKRVGLAVTDTQQIIASGLTTIHSKDIFTFLDDYLEKENIECFVIGEPKQMNNSPSESAGIVNAFIRKIRKKFPGIAINKVDERFTSKMASKAMIEGGLKKSDRRNKELVDKISATLILQSYLDSIQ